MSTKLRPSPDDQSFMRLLTVSLLGVALLSAPSRAAAPTSVAGMPAPGTPAPKVGAATDPVWETHLAAFDQANYDRQVEKLISTFEQATGRKLVPGPKRKVGLKIYADS